MTIKLPCYGIVIDLGEPDLDFLGVSCKGGIIKSDLREAVCDNPEIYSGQLYWADAIESIILGHACAGIDVASPAYIEGIETAVEACANNL